MSMQDLEEKRAVPAAYIDDVRKSAPVEAGGDLGCLDAEPPVHLRVEGAPELWFGVEVVPEFAAVSMCVGRYTGGDRREQIDEREFCAATRAGDVQQGLDTLWASCAIWAPRLVGRYRPVGSSRSKLRPLPSGPEAVAGHLP
jgi:hypothetical protein